MAAGMLGETATDTLGGMGAGRGKGAATGLGGDGEGN